MNQTFVRSICLNIKLHRRQTRDECGMWTECKQCHAKSDWFVGWAWHPSELKCRMWLVNLTSTFQLPWTNN